MKKILRFCAGLIACLGTIEIINVSLDALRESKSLADLGMFILGMFTMSLICSVIYTFAHLKNETN